MVEGGLRRREVGEKDGVHLAQLGQRGRHRQPAELLRTAIGRAGRDKAGQLQIMFARAQDRDLAQIARAAQRDAVPAARATALHQLAAFQPRAAEEVERRRQILGGQTRLFGETLRCQVIGIAVGRYLLDLNQALLHATLQVGVGQAQRNAQLARDRTLGHGAVFIHGLKKAEGDLGLAVGRGGALLLLTHVVHPTCSVLEQYFVHDMNVKSSRRWPN